MIICQYFVVSDFFGFGFLFVKPSSGQLITCKNAPTKKYFLIKKMKQKKYLIFKNIFKWNNLSSAVNQPEDCLTTSNKKKDVGISSYIKNTPSEYFVFHILYLHI